VPEATVTPAVSEQPLDALAGAVDVLIVGSGLMGATVARLVREENPRATIAMVDAAPPVGSIPGQHFHDTPEEEIRAVYNQLVSHDSQARYVGPEFRQSDEDLRHLAPGMYGAAALGIDNAEMPGASLAWNVGGMSVHWTAATPCPWGTETFPFGDCARWHASLERARRLLSIDDDPFGPTTTATAIRARLEHLFGPSSAPGRHPRPLPMALQRTAHGRWSRTGPNRIFTPIADRSDPGFTLTGGVQAAELTHDGRQVAGARLRDTFTGAERSVRAKVTVLCADALRSPQLLYASGIRPRALGRYLNEHWMLSALVHPDLGGLGLRLDELPALRFGEWRAGAHWVPHSGDRQPFHGQVTETYLSDDNDPGSYVLNLSGYAATDIRGDNHLEFSGTGTDKAGMPRIRIHFGYTDADRARLADARSAVIGMAAAFGPFDPARQFDVMPPGASLHWTGTVRMGTDPEDSVCAPGGRVWGFGNLFLAGNGVVPTALLINATLAGMVTAVQAGTAAARAVRSARI
jgi:choline dehydrogenase-like flavoprotein